MIPFDNQSIRVEPFTCLAQTKELILAPREQLLPHVCVYSNLHEFNPAFANHLESDIYNERKVSFPGVELVRLPPGTIVHGNLSFVVTINDVYAADQFLDCWRDPDLAEAHALSSTAPIIKIEMPCLLVARFGYGTWGHWVGELLPRVILAEMAEPGKFSFVVPLQTTDHSWDAAIVRNVLGSLHAYGIEEHRLLRIDQLHRYQFDNLSTVTSMWVYPYSIHPEALSHIRSRLKVHIPKAPEGAKAAAMLRTDVERRSIGNSKDIIGLVKKSGFTPFSIGELAFVDQVSIFREANTLFGVLGSNLTGLIYSPRGVKTLSVAPGDWGDCFFHGLIQAQGGLFADVRGTQDQSDLERRWSSFTLSNIHIINALEALRTATATG